MFSKLWESMGFQLLFGIFGIYSCYWLAGLLQEKMYPSLTILDSGDPTTFLIPYNGNYLKVPYSFSTFPVDLLGLLASSSITSSTVNILKCPP